MYTKRSSTNDQIQWQCSHRPAFKCNGSLYTILDNHNSHASKPHVHEPEVKADNGAKAKAAMKVKSWK